MLHLAIQLPVVFRTFAGAGSDVREIPAVPSELVKWVDNVGRRVEWTQAQVQAQLHVQVRVRRRPG